MPTKPRPLARTFGNYFGSCPHCAHDDGYRNIGRDHWFCCDEHKLRWRAGSNLFGCWRDETPEIWEENERILSQYEIAEPVYFDPASMGAEVEA